ncbi:hypothetical protein EYF80_058168 [Liparis tanakae]|uniref:Uncharacterized protein n=1 Tax=Liparis tanakae TaxID=230148 RepID=A0A4Z2ERX7_9TELE|nr:hypothetical protein EYF80_058168 [Liparis tanakae]
MSAGERSSTEEEEEKERKKKIEREEEEPSRTSAGERSSTEEEEELIDSPRMLLDVNHRRTEQEKQGRVCVAPWRPS